MQSYVIQSFFNPFSYNKLSTVNVIENASEKRKPKEFNSNDSVKICDWFHEIIIYNLEFYIYLYSTCDDKKCILSSFWIFPELANLRCLL